MADYDYVKGKLIIRSIDYALLRNSDNCVPIMNTLVTFYGHFGEMSNALDTFNAIDTHKKDTISINAMMTALINNEYFANALDLYKNQSFAHLLKTEMTYALAIKACQSLNDFECGKRIISETNHSLAHSNIQIKNTLIDFYGHCGDIILAMQSKSLLR